MSPTEPTAAPGFFPAAVWNHDEVAYPTDRGGALVVGPGPVELGYRLDVDHGGDPARVARGLYNVACTHRLADAAGDLWEARTTFDKHLFVNRLLDLDSLDWPLWAHHDAERARAVAERPVLTGLQVMEDDRFYRRFWLDDTLLEIQFKYQGLTVDVGHLDKDRVAVRLSGFFGSWCHAPMENDCYLPRWEGGRVRPPQQEYDELEDPTVEYAGDETPGGWLENLSPVVYSLWVREFLFRNDATWEREYPAAAPLPRPLTFRRAEGARGEPQPGVTFRPG